MRLKQYLLSISESKNDYSVLICFYFEEFCKHCKRVWKVIDEEYTQKFDSVEVIQQQIKNNAEYYAKHSWLFYSFGDVIILDESKEIFIIIAYEGEEEAFCCEECKSLKKANKKTASQK